MSSRDEVAGVVGPDDVRRTAVLSDETQAEDFARHQVVTAAVNLRVHCCKLVTGGIRREFRLIADGKCTYVDALLAAEMESQISPCTTV